MVRAACLALAAACCACTSASASGSAGRAGEAARPGAVITVGSFDFPESVLLADLYAGALGAQGFPVRVLPDLGPRELVELRGQDPRLVAESWLRAHGLISAGVTYVE
jgi:glycine betaine/choline ABC-type transport system substrate-binding protein